MVLIFESMVSHETRDKFHLRWVEWQIALGFALCILLPLNLTLVKFIPNFTPTHAITYTYTAPARICITLIVSRSPIMVHARQCYVMWE